MPALDKNCLYFTIAAFLIISLLILVQPTSRANYRPGSRHYMEHHDHSAMAGSAAGVSSMTGAAPVGDEMGGMQMTFYNSYKVTLFVDSWSTNSWTSYAVALLALVALGLLHERVTSFRSDFIAAARSKGGDGGEGGTSRGTAGGMSEHLEPMLPRSSHRRSQQERLTLAGLYALNLVTGYLLMLAVMTYNVGCLAAVVVGMALGYFLVYDGTAANDTLARGDGCHGRGV